jgi:nucleoside-diphosphate-sugar epimerase
MLGERETSVEDLVTSNGFAVGIHNPLAQDLDLILEQTAEFWKEVKDQRIFITGGSGFFGCWLLESFVWANRKMNLQAKAVILSRHDNPLKNKAPHLAADPALTFHLGEVSSFGFPHGSFSLVIHAAAAASARLNEENPLLMFDTVVQGTRRTLEFALACGASKVLFTSSGAVYGRQPPGMSHVSEDHQGGPDIMAPLSAYGEGKRASEFLCAVYGQRHGLDVKIARCFTFVGPYLPLDIHYAVGNFIRDGLQGGPIVVTGDGTPYRSYLYAADLATWLWTILFKGESCRPYNVGSAQEIAVSDLARAVAESFDSPDGIRIERQPEPGAPIHRYVPSVARAETELRLRQTVGLKEALQKTAQWHRKTLAEESSERHQRSTDSHRRQLPNPMPLPV